MQAQGAEVSPSFRGHVPLVLCLGCLALPMKALRRQSKENKTGNVLIANDLLI